MNNMQCADVTALMAKVGVQLGEMDVVATEGQIGGLSLSSGGTEVVVIIGRQCLPSCNIVVNGIRLKQANVFLGATLW